MAESIEYQILLNMQTALSGITVANGFKHTIVSLAVKLDADAKVEEIIGGAGARPFIILDPQAKQRTYPEKPNGMRVIWPITVHFVNDSDPKTDPAMLLTYSRMVEDAEKALAADSERGGLATDTLLGSDEKREYEGALVWALIPFQIIFRRTYGSP